MTVSPKQAGQTVGAAPVIGLRSVKEIKEKDFSCFLRMSGFLNRDGEIEVSPDINQKDLKDWLLEDKPRYSVVNLLKIKDWFIRNHRVSLSDNELDKFFEVIKNKKKVEAILNG